jgi:hypothetical protein
MVPCDVDEWITVALGGHDVDASPGAIGSRTPLGSRHSSPTGRSSLAPAATPATRDSRDCPS